MPAWKEPVLVPVELDRPIAPQEIEHALVVVARVDRHLIAPPRILLVLVGEDAFAIALLWNVAMFDPTLPWNNVSADDDRIAAPSTFGVRVLVEAAPHGVSVRRDVLPEQGARELDYHRPGSGFPDLSEADYLGGSDGAGHPREQRSVPHVDFELSLRPWVAIDI